MIVCVGVTPALQRTLTGKALMPGQVNRVRLACESVGGKAVNAARAVMLLGADVVVTGFTGGDTGRAIEALLDAEGLPHAFVDSGRPVRLCQTVIDQDPFRVTELVEEGPLPDHDTWTALLGRAADLASAAGGGAILVLAGALPPGAPAGFYGTVARMARKAGLRLIADTRGAPLWEVLAAGALLVKLNRDELAATLVERGLEAGDTAAAARLLLRDGGSGADGWALVTDGAKDAVLVGPQGAWSYRPRTVQAVNTIGCGDAVTAGIAWALAEGIVMPEAAGFGLGCGTASALTLRPGDLDATRAREFTVRGRPLDSRLSFA